jgi:hypothetical protein
VGDAVITIGRALTLLGTRLRDVHDLGDAAPPRPTAGAPQAPAPPDTPPAVVRRGGLGPRQLAVLALGGLDTPVGLAASDVMKALNYRRPNAHTVLDRLTELGCVELVSDQRPARSRKPQPAGE